ncbi:DUF7010 family protein [Aurantiacibacter aquimixticola]|uniref:Uncharacterized protein n=1 Tax=Aurantiacibacter aquimixticola TaxID=1958945 RepID=A0A419RU04_9SPHN|nr:hypothetical protein [Aurantiacibacter aquimixticola]RJY09273.1 hypothetical protein D6201_07810 [Aurantiacibacter aquimixticola]
MTDYDRMPLAEARRDYLANSTAAMPIGGLIAWGALAIAYALVPDGLPSFLPYVAAAIPVPIALAIDALRGELHYWRQGQDNPVSQLFMRFITVVAMLIPLVIIAATALQDVAFLVLGLAIFAGLVWVPHGWGADDTAGFVHFVIRAAGCYAAYLLTPQPYTAAAVAGVAALTYVYAIIAMKKPASVR